MMNSCYKVFIFIAGHLVVQLMLDGYTYVCSYIVVARLNVIICEGVLYIV